MVLPFLFHVHFHELQCSVLCQLTLVLLSMDSYKAATTDNGLKTSHIWTPGQYLCNWLEKSISRTSVIRLSIIWKKKEKIQLSGGFKLAISISVHLLAVLTVTLHGNAAFHLSKFFIYPNTSMSQAVQITEALLYMYICIKQAFLCLYTILSCFGFKTSILRYLHSRSGFCHVTHLGIGPL